ncbi:MAG: hypothetical protein EXS52_00735 [Candidatus Staskawiczbacteria bacterium]|nr:hypothetical protein [Candidatus Staskawiczbacteria bacterium]
MKKVYITGVPGIGKSTIVEELIKRGIFAFDIDFAEGLCAWRNKKTNEEIIGDVEYTTEWLEAHDWICNAEKLKEILKQGKEMIVAAGIAANQAEYLDLFDKVFLLQCSEKTFLDRMANRKGDNEFGKSEVERQYVLSFHKDFEQKLITRGAIIVNAEESIDVVVNNIISKI